MACSVQYVWHNNTFSYNGSTVQQAPIANNTSVSDSDIELLNCRDNIFEANSNISIVWNTHSRSYYGGKIEVANLLTSGCQSGLTWDVLARVVISWRPQFKTKNGLSISNQTFSAEWNTLFSNDMPVNRISDIYNDTHNNILYNILFEVPTDSEISPAIQREVDNYCASIDDEFDKYVATPYFYISKFCIVKNWGGTGCLGNYSYNCACDGGDCSDSRTSQDNQNLHFIISDGISNISEIDIPFLLSEGASQEKAITTYMNDSLYNSLINNWNLNNTVMARCYFNGGVVRSACTVRLVARVYGESLAIEPSVTPPYVSLDSDFVLGHDVDILRANFEPCSDKPIRIAEDLSSYLAGLRSSSDISLGFSVYQVIPYKVVIENCTSLSDFCCDNEQISDNDSIEIERPSGLIKIYGGNGGQGGGSVDIQCICDNLNNINNTLLAFKNANESALSGINDTLSNINIDVDNECVCDNLSEIKDSIDSVKGSIDRKELSVVNNNTVQQPVNNISVQPPVNNISLPTTQLENIATNTRALNCVCASLQNLEVIEQGTKESIDGVKLNLQCGKDDNISCILDNVNSNISNIADSLVCGNDGIACVLQSKNISIDVDVNSNDITNGLDSITEKLDDINNNIHDGLINSDDESNLQNISKSLNTSDDESKSLADVLSDSLNTSDDESKSLADVINNKEMGTNIDVEVSPADDVNVNRVYYTNQRNGDTNI